MLIREVTLLEHAMIQEGIIGDIKKFITSPDVQKIIPFAKKLQPYIAAKGAEVNRMAKNFAKMKQDGSLNKETALAQFKTLAQDVADEIPQDQLAAAATQLTEGQGVIKAVAGSIYTYLAVKTAAALAGMSHLGVDVSTSATALFLVSLVAVILLLIDYRPEHKLENKAEEKEAKEWARKVYIGAANMEDVPEIYRKRVSVFLDSSRYTMPDAWKRQREQYRINGAAQRNAPTLNEPARSTGGDAGLLKYAVYLYAIQQAYGQDTAKVRQALQQYIQATGDRNGVNQLFNSVKQEVSTNRAVADSLAQKLLNPETSNAIISRLLQSVAGAGHEEF